MATPLPRTIPLYFESPLHADDKSNDTGLHVYSIASRPPELRSNNRDLLVSSLKLDSTMWSLVQSTFQSQSVSSMSVVLWDDMRFPYIVFHVPSAVRSKTYTVAELSDCVMRLPGKEDADVHNAYTSGASGELDYPAEAHNIWNAMHELLLLSVNPDIYRAARKDSLTPEQIRALRMTKYVHTGLHALQRGYHAFRNMDAFMDVTTEQYAVIHELFIQWAKSSNAVQPINEPPETYEVLKICFYLHGILFQWHRVCTMLAARAASEGPPARLLHEHGMRAKPVTEYTSEPPSRMEYTEFVNRIYNMVKFGQDLGQPASAHEVIAQDVFPPSPILMGQITMTMLQALWECFCTQNIKLPAEMKLEESLGNGANGTVWRVAMPGSDGSTCYCAFKVQLPNVHEHVEAWRMSHSNTNYLNVGALWWPVEFSQEYLVRQRLWQCGSVDVTPFDCQAIAKTQYQVFHLSMSRMYKEPLYKTMNNMNRFMTKTFTEEELVCAFKYTVGYAYSQLRRIHAADVVHQDPHFGNFMFDSDAVLHCIDLDMARFTSTSLFDSKQPYHSSRRSYSSGLPTQADDTKPRQLHASTVATAAQECLFFFSQVFLLGGRLYDESRESATMITMLNVLMVAKPDFVPNLRRVVQSLRLVLGPGSLALIEPRTYMYTEDARVPGLPAYSESLQSVGRRVPLFGGHVPEPARSLTRDEDLQIRNLNRVIANEERVLKLLDGFIASSILNSQKELRTGRDAVKKYMLEYDKRANIVDRKSGEKCSYHNPIVLSLSDTCPTSVSESLTLGKRTVLVVSEPQFVYTIMKKSTWERLKGSWRSALHQAEHVTPVWWLLGHVKADGADTELCWVRSLITVSPTKFSDPASRHILTWNRQYVDQWSPFVWEDNEADTAQALVPGILAFTPPASPS